MSQNQNSQSGENNVLLKYAGLAYNPAGFLPSGVTFRVTQSQLKPVVLAFAREFLSDISNVTFEANHKTGELFTFVWLPSDSRHLRDNSAMTDRSAIRVPITRFSSELKDFMEKFCRKDSRNIIGEENGMHVSGIPIDLPKIAKLMFDENGTKFSRDFNTQKVSSTIRLQCHFGKSTDGQNFGAFKYVEITKFTRTGLEEVEPKPKKSHKAI